MCASQKVLTIGLLPLCTTACHLPPSSDPAPFPSAERAPEAEGAVAAEPSATVARERLGLPRLLWGTTLSGARIENPGGGSDAVLDDLLIDSPRGDIVGIAVTLPGSKGGDRVVAYESVAWSAGDSGAPALAFRHPLDESSDPYTELFEGRSVTEVSGEITEIEAHEAHAIPAIVFKVHDEDNLFHRVLVEPAHLVRTGPLTLGHTLRVEGALTRDSTGKLLIASALVDDEERLVLRDSQGSLLWGELAARFQSARDLSDRSILTADEVRVPVRGWLLDWSRGVAAYLCLDVGGTERLVSWSQIEPDETNGWRVRLERAALDGLPTVSADGVADRPL